MSARPRRVRRRLTPAQVDQLCAAYASGTPTRELADRFGLGKTAVTRLLRQEGATLRHQGLTPEQVTNAVRLYATGLSVARVAQTLALPTSSVYDALRRSRERG